MSSTRQKIRDYLAKQTEPKWLCEIIADLAAAGVVVGPSRINAMVREGQVIRHGETQPHAYSIGKTPRAYGTMPCRKEAERARLARRSEQRRAVSAASSSRQQARRSPAPVVKRAIPAMSSFEFEAMGGKVERLPGFRFDGVYAPRKPQAGPGVRSAA